MTVNPTSWSTTPGSNTTLDSISTAENVMTVAAVNNAFRSLMAGVKEILDAISGGKTTAGTANAQTLTTGYGLSAYAAGQLYGFKAGALLTNTAATTLNVDSLGAKSVKRADGTALVAGDITAGGIYLAAYEASADVIILLTPTPISSSAFQPLDADLTTWAGLTPSANAQSLVTAADYAAMRTLLSLAPGTDVFKQRTITAGTGISISNGDGVSGNPTITATGGGSGQTLATFHPYQNEPPSSNYATAGLRNGHPTLQFDDTTSWTAIFTGIMPRRYAGGGLTVNLHASAIATSGTMGWLIAIERIDDSSLDIDADSFASDVTVTAATVPGTSGQTLVLSGAFTSGAAMDSLAAGEQFRLRVKRDVANDTAVGNVELTMVEIKET